MNAAAVGADGDVKSMLQMEIGIDGDGVIASNNRPCLQMEYIPASAIFGLTKQFRLGGFNLVHFDMVSEGGFPSMFIVGAGQTNLLNNTMVDWLLPGSGANTIWSVAAKIRGGLRQNGVCRHGDCSQLHWTEHGRRRAAYVRLLDGRQHLSYLGHEHGVDCGHQ